MIEVKRLTEETGELLWTVEDRRLDSEQVLIRPKAGAFELTYKPLPGALWRLGNTQREVCADPAAWRNDADKDAYFAWLDDILAGQLLLEEAEHNLAAIRDIRVNMTMRRHGVGEALVDMAEQWARAKKLGGLVVETQDVNAGACQFFTRCGFSLGGVDMLRYAARSQATLKAAGMRESALFFYKFVR